jgi:hypothetical protein
LDSCHAGNCWEKNIYGIHQYTLTRRRKVRGKNCWEGWEMAGAELLLL